MHRDLKQTFSALLISTTTVACGGSSDTSKSSGSGSESQSALSNQAPSLDGSAQRTLSIGDGSIRPEVASLYAKGLMEIINQRDHVLGEKLGQIQNIRIKLDEMQKLLDSSTNQLEKDLLKINYDLFLNRLRVLTGHAPDKEQLDKSTIEQKKKFLKNYIQSKELRSLILQRFEVMEEKKELENHPEKVREREALDTKEKDIAKKLVPIYLDPDLDELTRKEFKALDDLGILTYYDRQEMQGSTNNDAEPISARTPNFSDDVSLRRVRSKNPSADFSQLMVNGLLGGYAPLQMPIYVQLKGTVENSKVTKDLTGTVVYKFNNTLVGMIHGHANASNNKFTSLNHNESSVVVSHSFGKTFLEGQAGVIHSTINQHNVSGERYQLSAGYDFEYFTPFVQASTRNLNAVNEYSAQAGCEVDVMNLVTDQYKLSTRMTLKGGYHSFKGTIGSFEGSFELGLNSGVNIQIGVKLSNNNESAAKISVSFDH